MTIDVSLAPPNSLILISDKEGGDPPSEMGGSLVTSSGTCVAVGTRSEIDGDTKIHIGRVDEVNPGNWTYYSEKIPTPSGVIRIFNVIDEEICLFVHENSVAELVIWVNDDSEPDEICIGVG